jgi:hypothetical protein
VISYRVTLDVPLHLARYVTDLLAAHRREIGTRDGARALTCWKQAIFALAWFRDAHPNLIPAAEFRVDNSKRRLAGSLRLN